VLDVALGAVGAYAAVVLTAEITVGLPGRYAAAAVVLAAAHGGSLAFRSVAPRAVLAVQAGTAVAYVALDVPAFMLGPAVFVTMYTVASRTKTSAGSRDLPCSSSVRAVCAGYGRPVTEDGRGHST